MKMMQRNKEKFLEQDTAVQQKAVNQNYQGFYEDHADYAVPSTGFKKQKIIHVFTGDWHRISGDKKAFLKRKWIYALLFMAGAACFLGAAFCDMDAYRQKAVALLQFLDIAALGWTLADLISYWLAQYKMTTYMYKSIALLRAAAALSGISMWVTGVLILLYTLLQKQAVNGTAILCITAYGLAGASLLILARLESKTVYIQEESTETPPSKAFRIQ